MKYAFSTLMIEGPDGFKRSAEILEKGVSEVELTWNLGWDLEDADDFFKKAEIFQSCKIKITSMHAPLKTASGKEVDLSSTDGWDRKMAIREVEKSILAWQRISPSGKVVIHAGRVCPAERIKYQIPKAIASLKEIIDFIEGENFDVQVAIENTLPGEVGCFLSDLAEIKEKVSSPRLGFCIDAGHYNIGKKQDDVLAEISSQIFEFHLHSNDGKMDLHLPPQEGNIDWKKFFSVSGKPEYGVFEIKKSSSDAIESCKKFAAEITGGIYG